MVDMIVRDAVADDAIEIADMHARAWREAYQGLLPDLYLANLRVKDRAASYFFSGEYGSATIVVVVDGHIGGFTTVAPSRENAAVGQIWAMYVDPDRWGGGIGKLLMLNARLRLRGMDMTDAVLWVLVGNSRAERFYRADGWLPDGHQRQAWYGGTRVDEVCYRRSLTAEVLS